MEKKLFSVVTEATGLPQDLISGELEKLLNRAGIEQSELTLDELRLVLAEYVQDVLLAAQEEHDKASSKASGD